MGNMSYARFRNTVQDLKECYDHMDSLDDDQVDEQEARRKLIKLCVKIANEYGDELKEEGGR